MTTTWNVVSTILIMMVPSPHLLEVAMSVL